jgi:hypothetical protein
MNTPSRWGLGFCGAILSAIHFATAALLVNAPLLMLRFEDMVGSGDTKPYWPPSRLRDAAQAAGDILSLPARWVYDSCPGVPAAAVALLFVLNSCLWGFALAIGLRFLFNRLYVSHEPHPV